MYNKLSKTELNKVSKTELSESVGEFHHQLEHGKLHDQCQQSAGHYFHQRKESKGTLQTRVNANIKDRIFYLKTDIQRDRIFLR